MKRVTSILTCAFVMVLVTAGTALAGGDPNYPVPGDVSGSGGTSGGTAFTGGDVTFGALAAVALLAIGVTTVLVARRRAAKLSG
jgi:hypothetical protein